MQKIERDPLLAQLPMALGIYEHLKKAFKLG